LKEKTVQERLTRAASDLDASRLLLNGGFLDQATSRAYYAAFYAAEAALLRLGETRSSHSGLIAAFGALVVKKGGFEPNSHPCCASFLTCEMTPITSYWGR